MKTLITLMLFSISHLLSLAHAKSSEDFIHTLQSTHINGIDAALIRLELCSAQENKQLSNNKAQLIFIYTNNKLELSIVIKKETHTHTS